MANMNTYFVVKNIQGTATLKCACKTWIQHWRRYTGEVQKKCCVLACGEAATVGAHVISIDRRYGRKWFIVPMCRAHNIHHNKEHMTLEETTVMVLANQNVTCRYDHND